VSKRNDAKKSRELMRFLNRSLAPVTTEMSRYIYKEIWVKKKPISKVVDSAFTIYAYDKTVSKFFEDKLILAVLFGYGEDIKIKVVPEATLDKVMNRVWTDDGLSLSKRLKRAAPKVRASVKSAIRKQVKESSDIRKLTETIGDIIKKGDLPSDKLNQSIVRLSRNPALKSDVNKIKRQIALADAKNVTKSSLITSYKQFITAIEAGNDKQVAKLMRVIIDDKANSVARRIARTEISRAWTDGFFLASQEDEDIEYYKWQKVSNHIDTDVCTFHSKANLFGLGPGIYPKTAFPPLPAFPNCRCYIEEVLRGDVKNKPVKNKSFRDKEARKYLDSLPEGELKEVMGRRGFQEYKRTGNWRAMPQYKGLENPKSRFAKADIERIKSANPQ